MLFSFEFLVCHQIRQWAATCILVDTWVFEDLLNVMSTVPVLCKYAQVCIRHDFCGFGPEIPQCNSPRGVTAAAMAESTNYRNSQVCSCILTIEKRLVKVLVDTPTLWKDKLLCLQLFDESSTATINYTKMCSLFRSNGFLLSFRQPLHEWSETSIWAGLERVHLTL